MPVSKHRKRAIKRSFIPPAERELRANAARVDAHRRENGLCLCEVETVPYETRADHQADETPNKICPKCERKILRLGLYPTEEARKENSAEFIAKGLFGQKLLLESRLR
jgi:hypothetical protein